MSPVRSQREQRDSGAKDGGRVVAAWLQLHRLELELVRPSRTLSLSMRSRWRSALFSVIGAVGRSQSLMRKPRLTVEISAWRPLMDGSLRTTSQSGDVPTSVRPARTETARRSADPRAAPASQRPACPVTICSGAADVDRHLSARRLSLMPMVS